MFKGRHFERSVILLCVLCTTDETSLPSDNIYYVKSWQLEDELIALDRPAVQSVEKAHAEQVCVQTAF